MISDFNMSQDLMEFFNTDDINLINVLKENNIYDIVQYDFNVDKILNARKFNIFSPQMIPLIYTSNYSSFLEYGGGVGVLSEVMKEIIPSIKTTYANTDSLLLDFIKFRIEKHQLDINVKSLSDFVIDETYDIIVSDGVIQLYDELIQFKIINYMIDSVNKNGLVCLLVDLSGNKNNTIYQDVDILKLHFIMEQSDMVCIYGKNTFSSLWKKII